MYLLVQTRFLCRINSVYTLFALQMSSTEVVDSESGNRETSKQIVHVYVKIK